MDLQREIQSIFSVKCCNVESPCSHRSAGICPLCTSETERLNPAPRPGWQLLQVQGGANVHARTCESRVTRVTRQASV